MPYNQTNTLMEKYSQDFNQLNTENVAQVVEKLFDQDYKAVTGEHSQVEGVYDFVKAIANHLNEKGNIALFHELASHVIEKSCKDTLREKNVSQYMRNAEIEKGFLCYEMAYYPSEAQKIINSKIKDSLFPEPEDLASFKNTMLVPGMQYFEQFELSPLEQAFAQSKTKFDQVFNQDQTPFKNQVTTLFEQMNEKNDLNDLTVEVKTNILDEVCTFYFSRKNMINKGIKADDLTAVDNFNLQAIKFIPEFSIKASEMVNAVREITSIVVNNPKVNDKVGILKACLDFMKADYNATSNPEGMLNSGDISANAFNLLKDTHLLLKDDLAKFGSKINYCRAMINLGDQLFTRMDQHEGTQQANLNTKVTNLVTYIEKEQLSANSDRRNELTTILNDTLGLLKDPKQLKSYQQKAQSYQKIGLIVLSGLMMAVAGALVGLGVAASLTGVGLPIGAGLAAAGLALGVGSYGLFSKSMTQSETGFRMADVAKAASKP